MAFKYIIASITGTADIYVYDNTVEGALVAAGVIVAATEGDAFYLSDNNTAYRFIVDGTVAGEGAFDMHGLNATLTVDATGKIFSPDGDGVDTYMTDSSIINKGVVEGWNTAISDHRYTVTGTLTISNSSEVIADDGWGFQRLLAESIGGVVLNNSGTFSGVSSGASTVGAYDASLGTGVDTITNTGTMIGTINLGAGADKYDGHSGHHYALAADGTTHIASLIDGGAGNDIVYCGSDADSISGGADNDIIRGGGGKDSMDGGDGFGDIVDYMDKTQKVQLTLQGASLASVLVNGAAEDSISNFEFVRGGSAGDAFTGDSLANLLSGFGGNDVLIGTGGADVLIGGAGADHLYGNTAAALNDAAKDSFNYSAITDSGVTTATEDVIYGAFNGGAAGGDKIDIGAVATGAGAAFTFIAGGAAFNAPGQVHVTGSGTNTYLVSLNTDADAAAEMSIVVHTSAAHTFTGGDFVL